MKLILAKFRKRKLLIPLEERRSFFEKLMLVYPSFVYLQNQKTGCTFVEECLLKFCSEPRLFYKKHAVLVSDPHRFCFTNVREALATYRSLYTYGLDGKGTVYLRLKRFGFASLYRRDSDAFLGWLNFILQPENANLLADTYTSHISNMVGLITWRFLRLACPGFEKESLHLTDRQALFSYIKSKNVLRVVLRQEYLRNDLSRVLSKHLSAQFPDQTGLHEWIYGSPVINASSSRLADVKIPDALRLKLETKEAILYAHFYPDLLAEKSRGGESDLFTLDMT